MFLSTCDRRISDYTRQTFHQHVSGSVAGTASEWVYDIVAVRSVLALEDLLYLVCHDCLSSRLMLPYLLHSKWHAASLCERGCKARTE